MLKIAAFVVLLAVSAYGAGEFFVLHHPKSLTFKGHDHVKENILKEVYSAALGFTTEEFSNWHGMYIEDPFDLPEAIVTIAVDGVNTIDSPKGHHFPLRTNEEDADLYFGMEQRITERYPTATPNLVQVSLVNGLEDLQQYPIFHGIKNVKPRKDNYLYLKNTVDEDREFLHQIEILNAVTRKIESGVIAHDNIPDVYWFHVSGLHALVDLHGDNSTAVKEAKQVLNEAILRLNGAFTKAYNGQVLVNVITSDASHTRKTRAILADKATDTPTNFNLAKDYDENFPVIFNIILWFSLVLFFALLGICLFIANMDPGRDSIIYRMTSTRMKKDN